MRLIVLQLFIICSLATMMATKSRRLLKHHSKQSRRAGILDGAKKAFECARSLTGWTPEPCGEDQFFDIPLDKSGRYVITRHSGKTADGWHLNAYRVRLSAMAAGSLTTKQRENQKQPVFFQHGIFQNGARWLTQEKNWSWGYYMADQGFDVWLGNNRGTGFSRHHDKDGKWADPKEKWHYSFTEMAWYDVRGNYEIILKEYSPSQKIIYVGFSQGTAQMFAALVDPKTSEFVASHTKHFIAFAPITYLSDTNGSVMNMMKGLIPGLSSLLGGNPWMCGDGCTTGGADGLTTRALDHLGQLADDPVDKPTFKPYNYGNPADNRAKYGADHPPEWDLTKFPTSVGLTLITGSADPCASPPNVAKLRAKLGSKPHGFIVKEGFDHMGFFKDANQRDVQRLVEHDLGLDALYK